MFRLIKIIFNAFLIVLAIIGFNAIGGQKYIEPIKTAIVNFVENHKSDITKKIGDFSKVDQEFHIEKAVNIMGYKAVIAEHNASGQKMIILDSGKKSLLTQDEIKSSDVEAKLKDLADKFKYQGVSVREIKVTSRGNIDIYGQSVPYAKFEAKASKLPLSDIGGIIASVKTSDGQEKLAISVNENKKYSQLITNEFYKAVKEGNAE